MAYRDAGSQALRKPKNNLAGVNALEKATHSPKGFGNKPKRTPVNLAISSARSRVLAAASDQGTRPASDALQAAANKTASRSTYAHGAVPPVSAAARAVAIGQISNTNKTANTPIGNAISKYGDRFLGTQKTVTKTRRAIKSSRRRSVNPGGLNKRITLFK